MSLMNAARMIQHRGSTSKSRISLMMEQKHKQELAKSEEIEKVALRTYFDNLKTNPFTPQECKELRAELDEQHKIRMEAFEIKMKPIIINEGPSKKVKR